MTSRLSSLLVTDGRVTAKKMADAFQRQVIFGGTLDTILLEMGLVDAGVLADYLSRATELPFSAELPSPDATTAVHQGFSTALVERFHALPLGRGTGGKLRVMVLDAPERQDTVEVVRELGKLLDRPVELVVGPEYRFQQALEMLYGARLLPRFAKIAGKIDSGGAKPAAPGPVSTAPSLFAGRKQHARTTIERAPAPAPKATGPRTVADLSALVSPFAVGAPAVPTSPEIGLKSATPAPADDARAAATPGGRQPTPAPFNPTPARAATPGARQITPAAVEVNRAAAPGARNPTPAPIDFRRAVTPGGRQATPAPVASGAPVAPGVPGVPVSPNDAQATPTVGDDRVRRSPFERAGPPAAGKNPTPAPLLSPAVERRTPVIAPTLRGISPVAPLGGEAAIETPAPAAITFDITTAPATLEDFVLPESAVVSATSRDLAFDGGLPEPEVQQVVVALSLAEGLEVLHAATDRDAVLEILCRIARSWFEFAALFVVHGDTATLSMALGAAFYDRASLRAAEVQLQTPSPLRTAVQTLSPYIGQLGDEDVLGETLAFMGRRVPTVGALLPIVLRGRCVAVLHVDDGGRVVSADELGELIHAASETAAAFLRIIQAAKKGTSGAPVAQAPAARSGPARASRPARAPIATAAGVPIRAAISPSGGTRASSGPVAAPQQSRISDLPASLAAAEVQRLLQVVENDDPAAGPAAAATLATAPAAAAAAVAERFPGLLRFAYRKPHAIGLSLAEHGPLLALAGRLGAPMVSPIIQHLSDSSADHRFYAALVLAELRADEAVVPLGLRIFDADPAVRRAASYALSRQPPSPALGRLLDQVREDLSSLDMDRQRAAAAAAGELRDVTGVPKLIDLLTHRDMEVVDLARRALVVITKQDFGTARWRWRSWWEKARVQSRSEWLLAGLDQTSSEARRSAIDELGVISTDCLGCHARLSRREREEAQRRFAEWIAQHPDALDEDKSS